MTRMIKNLYKQSFSFYSGASDESRIVEESVAMVISKRFEKTELSYLLSANDICEFETRAEYLRDLLLDGLTAISEIEINTIKDIFKNANAIATFTNKEELFLLALASILEPLFEISSYTEDVADIVRILFKSSYACLRYAALDIISFGLGSVSIADKLLLEAKQHFSNEQVNYVREYLESLGDA